MAVFFLAVLAGHFLPFPSPNHSAAYVSRFYREHTTGIRVAAIAIGLAGPLYLPWTAVLAAQLRRIRGGPWVRVFTFMELISGGLGSVTVWLPSIFFMTAAFRPGGNPAVTESFNDAAWLCLVVPIFPIMLQLLSLAAATVLDASPTPVFPRWSGFLNLWVAVLVFPSSLAAFFKTGPFAWNGILTLWLAAVALGVWMIAMVIVLLRAIRIEHATSTASPP